MLNLEDRKKETSRTTGKKSQKKSRQNDYSVHQIRFLKACFQKNCRLTLATSLHDIKSKPGFFNIHIYTNTAMSTFPVNTRFSLYLFVLQAADNLLESFSHTLNI